MLPPHRPKGRIKLFLDPLAELVPAPFVDYRTQVPRRRIRADEQCVFDARQVGRFRGSGFVFQPRRQRRQPAFHIGIITLCLVEDGVRIADFDCDGGTFTRVGIDRRHHENERRRVPAHQTAFDPDTGITMEHAPQHEKLVCGQCLVALKIGTKVNADKRLGALARGFIFVRPGRLA